MLICTHMLRPYSTPPHTTTTIRVATSNRPATSNTVQLMRIKRSHASASTQSTLSASAPSSPWSSSGSPPAPTAVPAPCDMTTLADTTRTCVAADDGAKQCLRGGGTNCDCLRQAFNVQTCLGPACWHEVEVTICAPEGGSTTTPVPTAPTSVCDEAMVVTKTQVCGHGNQGAVACLRREESDECACLCEYPSVHACLAECWPLVETTLCDNQPSASDQCACMRNAHSVKTCLRPCWDMVEKVACKDHDAKLNSHHTDTTTTTNHHHHGDHNKDSAAVPVSDARSVPSGGMSCTPSEATTNTHQCMPVDDGVKHCLASGVSDCTCLRSSNALKRCLESCWALVERAVCYDNAKLPTSMLDMPYQPDETDTEMDPLAAHEHLHDHDPMEDPRITCTTSKHTCTSMMMMAVTEHPHHLYTDYDDGNMHGGGGGWVRVVAGRRHTPTPARW
eukprot:m.150751 g.150751  ORF g.150751 m.150751 type:complete len:448 (-) comp11687_c0_seq2:1359-2702(-)